MIYFNNVTATYSKNSGLKNFSLRVDKGEMVYLVGPSGAGKSTVLKCLYNGVDINKGELLIENSSLPTNHPKIFKAQDTFIPWPKLKEEINALENYVFENDLENIINILRELVNGYNNSGEIVDYVFKEKLKNSNLNRF